MDRWNGERLRRVALDWVVPAIVLGVGVVDVTGHAHSESYPGAPAAHLAFLLTGVLLLGVRRKAPLAAPLAAMAVVTWWTSQMWSSSQQGPFEGFVVLVGAAYSLGASNEGRRLKVAGGALVAFFALGQLALLGGGGSDGDLLPLTFWVAAAFAIGILIRSRTEQAQEARRDAAFAVAEHESRTARAVEEERARIARELHDVVAHGLSVIVVQAGVERRTLGNGGVDIPALDAALGSIETAGREALVDLRRLLGLLRRSDEPPTLSPQPGLAQLEDLLGSVRETGVTVDLQVVGERTTLPPGLDLTVYRIVQEALTNVLKHADARRVGVALTFSPSSLEIEIADDGARRSSGTAMSDLGGGHGLIGMRERVSVFGGEVSAGPRREGGWLVRSRLPLTPTPAGRR